MWDDYGSPVERIAATDPRWSFKGNWRADEKSATRLASEKGAEASISFDGTGAIVIGPYLMDGGMIDVYLDGKLDRTLDVFSDEKGIPRRRVRLARLRPEKRQSTPCG